ncbi:MAG: thiamine diphosphokinase [Melioribacteraceae bacterium]|nr:thiamine diphosphokinase [Melioribacteraceae bacterium]
MNLIIGNGKTPVKKEINYLGEIGYDTIICADGGANYTYKNKIIPDFIIGDLDSIDKNVYKYYKDKSKIIHIKRQNDTDIEKVIKFLISKKEKKALLIGGTGDRIDHSICNLSIICKYFNQIEISILHENTFLIPIKGMHTYKSFKGEIVSLFGFDKKLRVTTKGLKYKLNNDSLVFGVNESLSNISTANNFTINAEKGIVFVIRNYEKMKKYDLLF